MTGPYLTFLLLLFFLFALNAQNKMKNHHTKIYFSDFPNLNEIRYFELLHGGHFLSHLIYLHDKAGYWAVNKSVYFSFQKIADRVIVLGGPIGNKELFNQALGELEETCKIHAVKSPIFYQVSQENKAMYEAKNYKVIKIGEEAHVSLQQFNLEGKKRGKLRTSMKRFQREGTHFKVMFPPFSDDFIQNIKEVSDCWLGDRSEKGFSVSFFDLDYIMRFPIGVLIDSNEQIFAFATLPSQQQEKTIYIDLMRYYPNSTNGTMDVLFLSIFSWAKDSGYQYCSLGMAPLANVGTTKLPKSVYECVARLTYSYGERYYKFKGLKRYKEKFATNWEPRYIAYKKTTLVGVLCRLIILIHVHPKKKKLLMLNFFRKAT